SSGHAKIILGEINNFSRVPVVEASGIEKRTPGIFLIRVERLPHRVCATVRTKMPQGQSRVELSERLAAIFRFDQSHLPDQLCNVSPGNAALSRKRRIDCERAHESAP